MHEAGSWIAVWQSVAPIVTGIVMIVMMKWFSHHWGAATIARTARVTSKLGRPGGRSSRPFAGASGGSRDFRR